MADGSNPFEEELSALINKYSRENNSDTPDFILANYMRECLQSFDRAVNRRRDWHSTENTKNWETEI